MVEQTSRTFQFGFKNLGFTSRPDNLPLRFDAFLFLVLTYVHGTNCVSIMPTLFRTGQPIQKSLAFARLSINGSNEALTRLKVAVQGLVKAICIHQVLVTSALRHFAIF